MLKILNLSNPTRFLNIVNHSRGQVLLRLPDQGCIDLKQAPIAQQMLRLMGGKPVELDLDLTDKTDTSAFLKFMLEQA